MNRILCLALVSLSACGGDDDPSGGEVAGPPPTFFRDISPITDRYCIRCHDGAGLGPGDFRDPAVVEPLAELMLARMDAGEMPPPAADPDCNAYQDADRLFLDPADRDLFARWVDTGKSRGDANTEPTVDWPEHHLTAITHELHTIAPYTPDFVDRNEYRCMLLDWDEAEDLYITGFEPIIDHAEISHHTVLFSASDGDAAGYVTDPATQSWKCDIIPDEDWMTLHAWAPGNNPVEMPPGGGVKIPGGSQLVLQLHYFDSVPDASTIQDSPGYYLNTVDDVDTEVYFLPLGPEDFTIPAGAANHSESFSLDFRDLYGNYDLNTTVYGVFPHMHVLGKSYDFHGNTPAGDEKCIARADGYDFSNQPTYWFDQPVVFGPDDSLSIRCTWDNSAANPAQLNPTPQDVSWGENTDQEMCFAIMYASVGF
jgi:hypothetical protein